MTVRSIWNWLVAKFRGGTTYTVAEAADVPDSISKRTLCLVGEHGKYWLAVMKCPCGCGEDIQLPMSSTDRPRWTYRVRSLVRRYHHRYGGSPGAEATSSFDRDALFGASSQ
jgi:Family of unknown function (DUF6527)